MAKKAVLELIIKKPLYADRTLPQKQAVKDLMQRTVKIMSGTEQKGEALDYGYAPEPSELKAAQIV